MRFFLCFLLATITEHSFSFSLRINSPSRSHHRECLEKLTLASRWGVTPMWAAPAEHSLVEPDPKQAELVAERAKFRRVSLTLWRWSVVSWWLQVILVTVSGVTLFFANAVTETKANMGAFSSGLFFSSAGLMLAFVSIFWTWSYSRFATNIRLRAIDSINLPIRLKKKFRVGIVINLLGTCLTLISAEQIVGLLIARVLSVQGIQTTFAGATGTLAQQYGIASQAIRPLDIFIVQANTNTLVAHFGSLVTTLWLHSRLCLSK